MLLKNVNINIVHTVDEIRPNNSQHLAVNNVLFTFAFA